MPSSESTNDAGAAALPPALLARSQEAQVAMDEAKARQAAIDADNSALTLAMAKYKSLVPDPTGVATNVVDDKSTGVAFSGLVTYSALNHAAEVIIARIANVIGNNAKNHERSGPHKSTILVTSQSDLLTNDLLSKSVKSALGQLSDFAERVLVFEPASATGQDLLWPFVESTAAGETTSSPFASRTLAMRTNLVSAAVTGATSPATGFLGLGAAAAGTAAFGPIGLAGAAVAAIPSIMSLFSSTTTVKDHSEDIADLATTISIISAGSDRLADYNWVHEDFRLASDHSEIRDSFERLAQTRGSLVIRQANVQVTKNEADLELSRAQEQQDAASKANPPRTEEADAAKQQVETLSEQSGNAAAMLALISAAISSIDAFSTAMGATAAGTRSLLAVASLNEELHNSSSDGIGYVLSVKGLGGQSEEFTKDRHIGHDKYTTLADATIAFMLYDVTAKTIISSGVANGVSSVHGELGQPPVGLIGPNSQDAIDDQALDAPPVEDVQQAEPGTPKHRWRHWFG